MTVEDYRVQVAQALRTSLRETGLAPVLLVGAGLSKRYMDAPTWSQLLRAILRRIDARFPLEFYLQRSRGDLIGAAEDISEAVHRWAWGAGRSAFAPALFEGTTDHHIFIKTLVATELRSMTEARAWERLAPALQDEVAQLQAIRNKIVVTTNYDTFFEDLAGLRSVFGKDTLLHDFGGDGFVLKVHGCRTDPASLVLMPADYDGISLKHKYVSAKLLTYFAERTVLVLGYSLYDPDIRGLLLDAAEALGRKVMGNVFFVTHQPEPDSAQATVTEVSENGRVAACVNACTTEFEWLYKALH